MQFAVINLPTFAAAAVRLDLAQELLAALADHLETPWTEAVRAYARSDFAAAAEILQSSSLPRVVAAKPTSSCSRLSSFTARWAPCSTRASARLYSPLPASGSRRSF
jgi:hypothetical protein